MPRKKTKQDSGVTIAPTKDFYQEPETVTESEVVQETETTQPIIGIVSDCKRLNVRKFPNSNAPIVTVLDAETEVTVDTDKSTDGYYSVSCNNITGYCMKQYITLK